MTIRLLSVIAAIMLFSGCTTPLTIAPHGTWDETVTELGPVKACKGGSLTIDKECAGWPLSLPMMPSPDTHYTELKAKAATQYHVDASLVVLRDIEVKYVTEINGVIRGWKAYATAGVRKAPQRVMDMQSFAPLANRQGFTEADHLVK